ncbi:putative mitochondrial intermediate peptidase mitochondrial precursor [Naematelia encephala]|uniref:Mitochondrial intermediate peptidase 1 n=1 Tax=Naematelia encephala TaxID=71784 RepID=A0A1Y2BG27_9TREE|nr:putative mitochondrial intermediate peptidase mitochondrial precursor [Naematelia encephala]
MMRLRPSRLRSAYKAAIKAHQARQINTAFKTALDPLKQSIRQNSSTATSASTIQYAYTPPPPLPASSTPDDDLLKAHFDLAHAALSTQSSPSGLFLLDPLTSSSNLPRLTERTLRHARAIVDRMCAAPSDPTGKELRRVIKNLDRLSDLLCGVIDMCELVRYMHPDPKWVAEAERAYEVLCSYMNELNVHPDLYRRSGIRLAPELRDRFVELSDNILSLGRTFSSYASAGPRPDPPIEIPDYERLLSGLGSQFIDSLPRGRGSKRGSVLVTPGSLEAHIIGRYARNSEARRLVYAGALRTDPERVEVLEEMITQRAELAAVLGKDTWADVALADKMAKTPSNVLGFLNSMASHHRPIAAAEVAILQRLKATNLTGNQYSATNSTSHLPPLYAWDRDYYSDRHISSLLPNSPLPSILPYFSVGSCFLGLSRLFSRLYGISFRPVPVAPGEVWHPSVRRLDVIDETEGQIGIIYCDLFRREGKSPNAAHYTVRCSRRVDDDDLDGDSLPRGWDARYGPGLEVEGERLEGRDGLYQLPLVVLNTDFSRVETGGPALLNWNEVETLFHEVGHAMHSMIGRTEFHNVSGTRCATDFVELPSILMELFASSPAVLSLFAEHYATGEALPLPLIQTHIQLQKSNAALETHNTITMALLDHQYHTVRYADLISGAPFDSSEVYAKLQQEVGVIPPVAGTSSQTQFGHLYGYGATYYSYLFDRAIAGKVFATLFNHTPQGSLSRQGGQVFKEKILKWGGGKDPWEMVASVVGGAEGDIISKGDEQAMDVVGSWMIR